jgi:hypothetical protein
LALELDPGRLPLHFLENSADHNTHHSLNNHIIPNRENSILFHTGCLRVAQLALRQQKQKNLKSMAMSQLLKLRVGQPRFAFNIG